MKITASSFQLNCSNCRRAVILGQIPVEFALVHLSKKTASNSKTYETPMKILHYPWEYRVLVLHNSVGFCSCECWISIGAFIYSAFWCACYRREVGVWNAMKGIDFGRQINELKWWSDTKRLSEGNHCSYFIIYCCVNFKVADIPT